MVEPLGHGRYLIVTDGAHRIAYAATDRGRTWVFVDGRTYVIEDRGHGESSRARADEEVALSAPMPATVIAVNVSPGQDVQAGDVLVTLEAMKMELSVTSPRAGRVKSIACREGELIQPGVPLVDLE